MVWPDIKASTLLIGVAWATVGLWLVGAFLTWRGITRQKRLTPVAYDADDDDPPLVSILVPARNEEHRVLGASVRSMLAQDYQRLEVVAVNDRSTDATGSILRSIANTNPRLRVIDGVDPLPQWLGKPHALRQALDASRGEWILATDADMIFDLRAVTTAMTLALAERLDAVTLIPHIHCLSFWERVFMPAFGWFMLMALPIERVNDPRRAEAVGVGGFFLMRRRALERIGGYEAVRGEVAEDLRVAEELKRTGARLRIEYAPELVSTRMQTNFREIWEGFTKNLFAGAKFSFWRAVGAALVVLVFSVAPPVIAIVCAIFVLSGGGGIWVQLFIPTLLVWAIQAATFALVNRTWDVPIAYAFTMPLGHALFVAILLNSAVRVATGRGVMWKGRRLYEREGVRPPRGKVVMSDSTLRDD